MLNIIETTEMFCLCMDPYKDYSVIYCRIAHIWGTVPRALERHLGHNDDVQDKPKYIDTLYTFIKNLASCVGSVIIKDNVLFSAL